MAASHIVARSSAKMATSQVVVIYSKVKPRSSAKVEGILALSVALSQGLRKLT